MHKVNEWLPGYKVIRKRDHDGGYESALAFPAVEYIIGEVTYSSLGNGPLAVFDSMDSAIDFMKTWLSKRLVAYDNISIFPCAYIASTDNALYTTQTIVICDKLLDTCPRGTRLATAVYILPKGEEQNAKD